MSADLAEMLLQVYKHLELELVGVFIINESVFCMLDFLIDNHLSENCEECKAARNYYYLYRKSMQQNQRYIFHPTHSSSSSRHVHRLWCEIIKSLKCQKNYENAHYGFSKLKAPFSFLPTAQNINILLLSHKTKKEILITERLKLGNM